MAYTGIFATLLEVTYYAGANANTTGISETLVNSFIAHAENYINVSTAYNWSDAGIYAALNAGTKSLLSEAAGRLAANSAIAYDMSGFTSLAEAQTMINYNWARAHECISLIEKAKNFVISPNTSV